MTTIEQRHRRPRLGVSRGIFVPLALVALECQFLLVGESERVLVGLPMIVISGVALLVVYRLPEWWPLVGGLIVWWLVSNSLHHVRSSDDIVALAFAAMCVFVLRARALDPDTAVRDLWGTPEGVVAVAAVATLVATATGRAPLSIVAASIGVILGAAWERRSGEEANAFVAGIVVLMTIWRWQAEGPPATEWSGVVSAWVAGSALAVAGGTVVVGHAVRRRTPAERRLWRSIGGVVASTFGLAAVLASAGEPVLAGLIGGAGGGLATVAIVRRRDPAWITGHAVRACILVAMGIVPFGFWAWMGMGSAGVIGFGMGLVLGAMLAVGSPTIVVAGWVAIVATSSVAFTLVGTIGGALTLAGGLAWWPILPGLRSGRVAVRTVALPIILIPGALLLRTEVNDTLLILVLMVVGCGLVVLAPWSPPSRIRAGRERRLRTRSPIGHASAVCLYEVCAAVQAVWDGGGRVLRPMWAWVAEPSPPQPPGRIERLAAAPGRRSYVLPLLGWMIGSFLVQLVSNRMAVHPHEHLFGPKGVIRLPYDLSTETRLGNESGNDWIIAQHGYRLRDYLEPVFPLVPLLLRAIRRVTGLPVAEAQIALSTVMGNVAVVAYWAFLRARSVAPRTQVVALALLLTYPLGFVIFGYGFPDTTLLALVLVAFLLAERGHPVWAGLTGGLATAARPQAGAIIVGLLLYELTTTGSLRVQWPAGGLGGAWRARRTLIRLRLGRMRPAQWGVLLSVSGVLAYSIWMVGHAGSPLYWVTAQSHYGHGSVLQARTWLKIPFLEGPTNMSFRLQLSVHEPINAVMVIGAICLVPAVHRRLGAGYSVFTALVLLIGYIGTNGFAAGGRYLMPAVPFLALVVADWLVSRRRALRLTLTAFVVTQVFLVAAFAAALGIQW